jgi:hypothetical protein
MARFWTEPRTSKLKIHLYMGLAYLVQYFLAWVDKFVSNNDDPTKDNIIPHFIALNGLVQGYSAYFSVKALPDAVDSGYYSNKAVASRKFIHENIFFSLMAVWGSVYLNYQGNMDKLQVNPLGWVVGRIFLFFPYVVVRPFFPTTSFSKGGSGRQSRSDIHLSSANPPNVSLTPKVPTTNASRGTQKKYTQPT